MKKNSFILYLEQFENLECLKMEERGELLTAIINHVKGKSNDNITLPVKLMLSFITQQIDRDRSKYIEMCERNNENGKLGGRPKKEQEISTDKKEMFEKFLKANPQIRTGFKGVDYSNIDFNLLHLKIKESVYLKRVTNFNWLVDNYLNIINGKYNLFNQ